MLADPSTYLAVSSHIFVGRRSALSPDEHSKKGRYVSRHNVEVATYDRILDLVRERYKDTEYWLNEN
jgi:hypothetical protein